MVLIFLLLIVTFFSFLQFAKAFFPIFLTFFLIVRLSIFLLPFNAFAATLVTFHVFPDALILLKIFTLFFVLPFAVIDFTSTVSFPVTL